MLRDSNRVHQCLPAGERQSCLSWKDIASVAWRVAEVLAIGIYGVIQLACDKVVDSFSGDGENDFLPTRISDIIDLLEGGFPKLCQIASTRPDLFSDRLCRTLSRFQERCALVAHQHIRQTIDMEYGHSPYASLSADPIGSATIAQVHTAIRRDDGRVVAVKIMRPGIRQQLECDCNLLRIASQIFSMVPRYRVLPIKEGVTEATSRLMQQTEFAKEKRNLVRLSSIFRGTKVMIPRPHEDLCRDLVLCMDYLPDLKRIDDPSLNDDEAREGVKTLALALFQMIFYEGFFHCDMHPGNVFIASGGRVAILDAGLVSEIDDSNRLAFVRFYLALAAKDGPGAARILRETPEALEQEGRFEAFYEEFIASVSQRTFGGTIPIVRQLVGILRRHRLKLTPKFTSPFLAIALFDSTARQRFPGLNINVEGTSVAKKLLRSRGEILPSAVRTP